MRTIYEQAESLKDKAFSSGNDNDTLQDLVCDLTELCKSLAAEIERLNDKLSDLVRTTCNPDDGE